MSPDVGRSPRTAADALVCLRFECFGADGGVRPTAEICGELQRQDNLAADQRR